MDNTGSSRQSLFTFSVNLNPSMKKLSLAMCLVAISAAGAHATTRLEVPVTYMANAEANEGTRRDCKIEEMLSIRIGPMLAKQYKIDKGTLEVGADPVGDKVLRVQISHVLGAGGGAWSGPKAITILAELLEAGKVVHYTKINEWTTGGLFGGYMGTCAILERSANALTDDLKEWVQNPSTQIEEKPAPKGAPVPGAEAPKASAPAPVSPAAPASMPASAPVLIAEEKAQK